MADVAVTEAKAARKVTDSFFREVDELSRNAGQVKKATRHLRRTKKQSSSYARKLDVLELKIKELRAEFLEPGTKKSAGADPAGPRKSGSAPATGPAADPIRTKLEQMVRDGQLLSSTDFLAQLELSKQALSKAVGANRMFYVDFRGDRFFPAFYTDPMYSRSQLEAVTKLLGELPGGAKLQFFLTPKGSLGGVTPLDAVAQGKLQKVKDVAAAFADQR